MRIPVGSEGCLLDMDTPEGYEDILSFWNNRCRRSDITQLAEGRRIFLIRHGQTRQHDEKMMIGQYDVPLNDEGREQMKKTAETLLQHEVNAGSIYSSDLERAAESAKIIGEHIGFREHAEGGNIKIINEKGFREISLGHWDGLPIREIKEKYPDEYRRRGEDIFTFKIGNKAENFYDMQYRAVAALRKILEKDMSKDLIIVTHSGVIRALENNLKGMRVDDEWKSIPKGGFTLVTV